MAAWLLVPFAIAAGLTTAGLLSAIHGLVIDRGEATAPLRLHFTSPPAAAWSLLMCAFAGPWLALSLAWPFWRAGLLAGHRMALVGLLAFVWSFFSGVFVVQAGLMVGLL